MKVAAQGVGCGGTKLRNGSKMFSGEGEVKEKLLSAQVRHCTSTRRMFSKIPKGREVQPTGDVLWCNQVVSVPLSSFPCPTLFFQSSQLFVLKVLTCVGLVFLFQFLMRHCRHP